MTAMNNDQLTKAIKSLGAQSKKNHARLLIAIAALGLLIVVTVIAMILNVSASNRVAAAIEQQAIGGTQNALLTRCLAVVQVEGVSDPRNYDSVVAYCEMSKRCELENQSNATAARKCVLQNNEATHQAELAAEQ